MIIEGFIKPWGELALYHDFALRMAQGQLPYRDFFPEYPPLALPFFRIPLLFGTQYYMLAYYALVAIFILFTVVIIKKMNGNPFAFLASVLGLGGLFWDRFDIFPAFFSVLAIYLAMNKNAFFSSFILALGFLTKIYPLLLAPLIILPFIIREPRKLIWSGIGFILPIFITLAIIVGYGGQSGLLKFIQFQTKRGIHLESIQATPLLIKHLSGEKQLKTIYEHNTFEIVPK